MKIKGIQVLKEASKDLQDGSAFYDRKEQGVGDYFWDSLIADIESLLLFAGVHVKRFGFYQMLSKRFPYAIYYEIKENVVRIVAVLPMRRDPAWIRKKLQKIS
ncbi:type II toxin-antitoxin system RelE/ParE family toxin [Deltaproteobacteria bacterium TL4]